MFADVLPFAANYVSALREEMRRRHPAHPMSNTQQDWLGFCITAMLLAGSLSWAAFERMSLGAYSIGALSWMFRHTKLLWSGLLQASVSLLLNRLKLFHGVLVLDDTDHRRAKKTKRVFGAHKVFDKKTGGYFNGQCLMFLLLVTDKFTLPVGVCFYRPDPKQQAWKQKDERLKKAGVKAIDRPEAPPADPAYPGKLDIALSLIDEFRRNHPDFTVKAVLADAAFGTRTFMEAACAKAGCKQAISQLRSNQLVTFQNKMMTVDAYFASHASVPHAVCVRGGETEQMMVSSARLWVKAHGAKRFVIAVKNQGEDEYRYLVATDLSWSTLDILRCYTLRWLVEVFIADWKLCEGWANMAKQPDKEGSICGVILSLMLDHALLIHPEQRACLENRTPAFTVGSLKQASHAEAFLQFVRKILQSTNPAQMLEQLTEKIKVLFPLAPSKKHMISRDLGRQEPSPSLRRYASPKILPTKELVPAPA